MKVDYVEESTVRKALAFEIDAEVVDREIEARAKDYAKKAKIPGFRPGKIPAHVIKQRFKQQVLEDVAEKIVNKVVHEELEGRGLRPIDVPKVTELKIDENQPMTFRAVFEILPLVELPDWKGLRVKAREAEVKDEAIDAEVERLREQAARFDPVEGRELREGDFGVLDVTWTNPDGTPGKKDENVLVEVGSADNHKDLNAGLVGMNVGDTKSIALAYGDDASENLRGKTVEYTVTLKGVKNKVLPQVDDEFAKDLGEWGSLSELRDGIRKRLLAADERAVDREVKNKLVEELVQRASFEVPEALVERHMNARLEHAARGLAYQGVDPRNAGVDWKQFREGTRDESVKAARADILLDEIGRRESAEVAEAEVDAEIGRMAERARTSKDRLRARMEKEGEVAALRARLREEKTLDLLKAAARLEIER